MLYFDDIKGEFESQGFKGTQIGISPDKDKSVLFLESVKSTQTVHCHYCGGSVYIFMKMDICVVNRCDPICAKSSSMVQRFCPPLSRKVCKFLKIINNIIM